MSVRKIQLAVGLILALAISAGAGAANVRFVGHKPPNAGEIERYVRRTETANLSADSIQYLLGREGYLDAEIAVTLGGVTIDIGPRSDLTRLEVSGDTSFATELSTPFTERNLYESLRRLLEPHTSVGHYFASGQVKSLSRDGSSITVNLDLRRGPLVKVEDIQITGLKRTSDRSIRRYLDPGKEDLLTSESVHRIETAAKAIPFVRYHPPVEINPRQGYTGADLVLHFSEQRPFRFEGGIGYTSGEDSRLVWSVDMTFNNLFGQGRLVRLVSERREKGRTVLDLQYRQPVFWLGLDAVRFGVRTRDYRDQFYEFAAEAGYRLGLDVDFALGLDLAWRSVEPSTDSPSHNTLSGKFSVLRSSLENRLNPSSGINLDLAITYSYREYDIEESSAQRDGRVFYETRSDVAVHFYQRLTTTLVGHLGLNYRGLETDEDLPPLSELIFVGGPTTLRGFRNEQFAAVRTAFGTVEPRLRFANGYLLAFYDAAYLNNRLPDGLDGVRTDESYQGGYGFGFAIEKAGRLLEISLGWNRQVSFDQPRLSVRFSADL